MTLEPKSFCEFPYFSKGFDVYVVCVCVYAHTHTLNMRYLDVSPGVGTGHLESPEEIQMYCCHADSIHVYCTCEQRTND